MIVDSSTALLAQAEKCRTPGCECPSCAPFTFVIDLLETPFPCSWPKPEVTRISTGQHSESVVSWDAIDGFLSAEESIAIGVALVRAGERAKAGG